MDARQRACLALQQQFESLWTAKRFSEALQAADSELSAAEAAFGPRHPAMVRALYDVAMAAPAAGDDVRGETAKAKAQALLHELEIEARQKPQDPSTATLLLFLGERDWNIHGDQESVLGQFQKALKIRQACFGSDHPATAEPLFRLAEAHYLAGRWEQAVPYYEQAIQIYENHQEKDHYFYGKSLEGLAHSLGALRRDQVSLPSFERAVRWAEHYSQDRQSLYYVLIGYAEALRRLSRLEEAAVLEQRALALLPKANPGAFGFQV